MSGGFRVVVGDRVRIRRYSRSMVRDQARSTKAGRRGQKARNRLARARAQRGIRS